MAASDLDAELRRSADATARVLLRDAREEAARIEAEATRNIDERRAATFESWEEELRSDARAEIAGARRDATRAVLLAKTRLVERVLERVRGELASVLGTESYQTALHSELERAIEFVGSRGTTVRCAPTIEGLVRDAVGSLDGARVEVDGSVGSGFVVSDESGRVQVDATLEGRLRRLAPTLSVEILGRVGERGE